MSTALLHISDLGIDFATENSSISALKNVSLEVAQGEIVAIVGESGSGKSITALSVLQLLPTPPAIYTSGKIFFSAAGGEPVNLLKQHPKQMAEIRGKQIAMIFQEPMSSLNPVFSCGEQVMEAIRQHKRVSANQAREQTIELFEKVKLPDPWQILKRYPHQLSGGQKQRVMIAMAMSCNPSLLICDEPTTALDVTVQEAILQLLGELQREENIGILFITHDLGVVASFAHRALVLYKGSVVEEGTVQEIFTHPRHPYTKGLLNCRPVAHPKGERLPVVSDFMEVGKKGEISEKIPALKKEEATTPHKTAFKEQQNMETLIRVTDLRVWLPLKKSFFGKPTDHVKAVDDISFDVYKGETLGLVGESGCGKTTLGRALLRLIQANAGEIVFNGTDLLALPSADLKRLRKEIQIVFQDPYASLNPRLTIGLAIGEPLIIHTSLSRLQRKNWVNTMLWKVGLEPEHFHRYPHEFSGGQRQRIVIARALALNPSFIVCDESVSALDVSVQAQVLNLLTDLKKEFGFTIIFISHDLSVVNYISDRIMVMNKGKIEEIGMADAIYHSPQKEYTKRLIGSIPGYSSSLLRHE